LLQKYFKEDMSGSIDVLEGIALLLSEHLSCMRIESEVTCYIFLSFPSFHGVFPRLSFRYSIYLPLYEYWH
jgi:hypothetical protein